MLMLETRRGMRRARSDLSGKRECLNDTQRSVRLREVMVEGLSVSFLFDTISFLPNVFLNL